MAGTKKWREAENEKQTIHHIGLNKVGPKIVEGKNTNVSGLIFRWTNAAGQNLKP